MSTGFITNEGEINRGGNGINSSTHKGTQSITLAPFLLLHLHFSGFSLLTGRGHHTTHTLHQ